MISIRSKFLDLVCDQRKRQTLNDAPDPNGSWGVGLYSTKEVFDGECDGYGFYRPKNPNHFFPDYPECTPQEIANHKLACELYDKGKYK